MITRITKSIKWKQIGIRTRISVIAFLFWFFIVISLMIIMIIEYTAIIPVFADSTDSMESTDSSEVFAAAGKEQIRNMMPNLSEEQLEILHNIIENYNPDAWGDDYFYDDIYAYTKFREFTDEEAAASEKIKEIYREVFLSCDEFRYFGISEKKLDAHLKKEKLLFVNNLSSNEHISGFHTYQTNMSFYRYPDPERYPGSLNHFMNSTLFHELNHIFTMGNEGATVFMTEMLVGSCFYDYVDGDVTYTAYSSAGIYTFFVELDFYYYGMSRIYSGLRTAVGGEQFWKAIFGGDTAGEKFKKFFGKKITAMTYEEFIEFRSCIRMLLALNEDSHRLLRLISAEPDITPPGCIKAARAYLNCFNIVMGNDATAEFPGWLNGSLAEIYVNDGVSAGKHINYMLEKYRELPEELRSAYEKIEAYDKGFKFNWPLSVAVFLLSLFIWDLYDFIKFNFYRAKTLRRNRLYRNLTNYEKIRYAMRELRRCPKNFSVKWTREDWWALTIGLSNIAFKRTGMTPFREDQINSYKDLPECRFLVFAYILSQSESLQLDFLHNMKYLCTKYGNKLSMRILNFFIRYIRKAR